MFAVLREAEIPQEITDKMITAVTYNNSVQFVAEFLNWIKQQEKWDNNEKSLRTNIISWAIGTISIGLAIGIGLEKKELVDN